MKKLGKVLGWIGGIAGGTALAAYATSRVTPKPEAFMMKQLFNHPYGIKNPELYAQASRHVSVMRDLSYSDYFDKSVYDLYLPSQLKGDEQLPVVIWLHGGGFVGGDKSQMKEFATYLTHRAKVAVITLNYGLTPANKYPSQLNQLDAGMQYLLKEPILNKYLDFSHIIFGGDSAGAQIAGQYVLLQTNDAYRNSMGYSKRVDVENIKGFISYCGPLAMSQWASQKHESFMVRYMLRTISRTLIRSHEWTERAELFEASIADHVNGNFPTSYITDGNSHTFQEQGLTFANKLRGLGVEVQTKFFEKGKQKVNHEYQFEFKNENALVCLDETIAFIEGVLAED